MPPLHDNPFEESHSILDEHEAPFNFLFSKIGIKFKIEKLKLFMGYCLRQVVEKY